MKQILTIKATHAAKYTLVFRVLGQLCGAAATVLLVRALPIGEYGVYNLLYSVIGLLGTLFSLGIGNTIQRYVPEYYHKEEFRTAHRLFVFCIGIRLIIDALVVSFLLLFWQEISGLLKLAEYKAYFMLFSLVILLHQQRGIVETMLTSYFLHKYSKALGFLHSLIRALGYGTAVFLNWNLWHVILIDLSAYLVLLGLLYLIYLTKIPSYQGNPNRLTPLEKKRLIRYAMFYNFNNAGLGFLNADFDNFIIAMYLNPAAVGAYAFCVRLSVQITSLLPVKYFRDVLKPLFFAAGTDTGARHNTTRLFQGIVKVNMIFAIPCFFFLINFSNDIIQVFFSNEYTAFSPMLITIFLFAVVNSLPIGTMAQLKERADIILYSKVFALFNLAADLLLIKFFGIWGAIFATGTSTCAKNLFIWYFVRKDASFRGMALFFMKIILFWASTSLLFHHLGSLLPLNPTSRILFGLLLYSSAFVVQFRCDYFQLHEKKIIFELVTHPFVLKTFKKLKLIPNRS